MSEQSSTVLKLWKLENGREERVRITLPNSIRNALPKRWWQYLLPWRRVASSQSSSSVPTNHKTPKLTRPRLEAVVAKPQLGLPRKTSSRPSRPQKNIHWPQTERIFERADLELGEHTRTTRDCLISSICFHLVIGLSPRCQCQLKRVRMRSKHIVALCDPQNS